jgi:carboxyl-terminal processing protease
MKRYRSVLFVAITTFLAAMACATLTNVQLPGSATATPPPAPTTSNTTQQLAVLEAIDQAVRADYIREDFDGVEWEATIARYRTQIETGLSEADFDAAMQALAAEFPAGRAQYITREARLETETRTYQGIGVFYGFREAPEPRVVVLSVIPESPAAEAGLQPHDAIYAVDGEPIRADERDTIVNRIRGEAGSDVTLTVQTPGAERREVTLQRGSITSSDDNLRGGVSEAGIAYYRLPVVATGETIQLIAQDLEAKAAATPLTGAVLDLRISSNGDDGMLLALLTLFGDGAYGELYSRTVSQTVAVEGVDVAGSQSAPLIVLVGPDTRGNAEVFAAAMQASGRATVVGLKTRGDVEGFAQAALPNGAAFRFIASSYRLPDGGDLAGVGVTPDVSVEGDWDSFTEAADDEALNEALNALEKK